MCNLTVTNCVLRSKINHAPRANEVYYQVHYQRKVLKKVLHNNANHSGIERCLKSQKICISNHFES